MASKRGKLTNLSVDLNGNQIDYDQTIKGDRIFIKYGDSIELPWRDCVNIRGHYCQGPDGKDVPVNLKLEEVPESGKIEEKQYTDTFQDAVEAKFKALNEKIESMGQPQETIKVYSCHKCGRDFTKKTALINHLKACKGGVDDTGDSSKLSEDNV